MGNCCKPVGFIRKYSSRLRQRKIVILMVGLDNAGKSSTAKGLLKEPVDNLLPTVGFNVVKLFHKGYCVVIYDLGGGPQIRDIWKRYFADVHGVIFVVDASDVDRLDECKKVFEDLLINENLAGKPVLLLANKQDKAGALDELDIVERLNVECLVNMQQCPTLVETCAAAAPTENGRKRKIDPGINNGYRWLLRRIISDYETLNKRVIADQEIQRIAVEKEREALRKRIEQSKENEEKEKTNEEDVDTCSLHVNPFQPIHVLVKEIENRQSHEDSVEPEPTCKSNGGDELVNKSDEIIDLETYRSGISGVDIVRDQLRQKSAGQKKKRNILKKSNRTAPINEDIHSPPTVSSPESKPTSVLPPIRQRGPSLSWAQVSNGEPSHKGCAWELEKTLDVITPRPADWPRIDETGSDADDVVTALR